MNIAGLITGVVILVVWLAWLHWYEDGLFGDMSIPNSFDGYYHRHHLHGEEPF